MNSVSTVKSVFACFGCSACATVCPRHAVRLHSDVLGFRVAALDETACIGCGACAEVCPALHQAPAFRPRRAYYGWNNDPTIRVQSSSGGIFSSLAANVVGRGGVVFGAAFDPVSRTIRHVSSDERGLAVLRGSKYVQSDMGDSFRAVRSALQNGREVLFCGTPCSVAGLKRFLRVSQDKLTTVDFICHGTGSPAVFNEILDRHSRDFGGCPVESVEFRDKSYGWRNSSTRILFRSGRVYRRRNIVDPFFQGFVDGCYFNDACYNCPFDDTSAADIRLSDFWGHSAFGVIPDCNKGVSLVFANTERGTELLSGLGRSCELREVPVKMAVLSQHHSHESRRGLFSNQERFLRDVARLGRFGAIKKKGGWTIPGVVFRKCQRVGFSSLLHRVARRLFK